MGFGAFGVVSIKKISVTQCINRHNNRKDNLGGDSLYLSNKD